jgi:hypothetical protein
VKFYSASKSGKFHSGAQSNAESSRKSLSKYRLTQQSNPVKLLFVLLLALNAFLFSVATGWLSLWEVRDPDRMRRQVEAERISVLSATGNALTNPSATTSPDKGPGSTTSGGADQVPSGPSAAPGASNSPTSNSTSSPVVMTSPVPETICLEFPPIEAERAQVVEASMKQAGITVELKTIETSPSYIVYLAPSESVKEAQRKLAELKRLGISDAFLMQDGPLKLGISLGLFRAEDGAKALLAQLGAKGIKSAKMTTGQALRGGKVTLRASGSDAQLARARQAASEVNLSLRPCG